MNPDDNSASTDREARIAALRGLLERKHQQLRGEPHREVRRNLAIKVRGLEEALQELVAGAAARAGRPPDQFYIARPNPPVG